MFDNFFDFLNDYVIWLFQFRSNNLILSEDCTELSQIRFQFFWLWISKLSNHKSL